MTRALGRAAYWLSPPLALLVLYVPGLNAWFQADDFAWLSLWRQAYNWPSFLHVMFAPMAQGTIRPWSERGFFLLFHFLFGVDALPWRIFVYLNACACLTLLMLIARRVLCDARAAWVAPLVWMVSAGMPVPMTWTSDYNQIQSALFLLGAFYLRLRGIYWAELLVFVLGFGALETNVVYPAIALAWVLIAGVRERRGRDLSRVAPMFLISVLYFVLHAHLVQPLASGPYAMHLDWAMPWTLATYWRWAMVAPAWVGMPHHPQGVARVAAVLFTAALAFVTYKERRIALFGSAWFALTLAPLLPLRDHISAYYLAVPSIGLALWVAAGIALANVHRADKRDERFRVMALVLLLAFLIVNSSAARFAAKWNAERSARVRTLMLGAATAHRKNPGKALLLDGLDVDLLSLSVEHSAFRALDIPDVYLSWGTVLNDVNHLVLPPGPTLHALAEDRLAVYRINGDRLRNVTTSYERFAFAHFQDKDPLTLDLGNPLVGYLLGPEWYPPEGGHRWMPRRATLRLGGPSTGDRLALTGFCPQSFVSPGAILLTVALDGQTLPSTEITKPETPFLRMFNLPDSVRSRDSAGKKDSVLIRIDVNKTLRSPRDERELGLAFGVIEFRSGQ